MSELEEHPMLSAHLDLYIQRLPWSGDASEHERALVECNIRTAVRSLVSDGLLVPIDDVPVRSKELSTIAQALRSTDPHFDFVDFLKRKHEWSEAAFGPVSHRGPLGPLDHLRKEIAEAEENPADVTEFADLIFLATDAAWRAGHSAEDIAQALEEKLTVNMARDWPDWRTAPADKAIEHVRQLFWEESLGGVMLASVGSLRFRVSGNHEKGSFGYSASWWEGDWGDFPNGRTVVGKYTTRDEACRALERIFSSLSTDPQCVVVKELEWVDRSPTNFVAFRHHGSYVVDAAGDEWISLYWPTLGNGADNLGTFATIAEAKAACQADHARRITDHISLCPCAEAKAERAREMEWIVTKAKAEFLEAQCRNEESVYGADRAKAVDRAKYAFEWLRDQALALSGEGEGDDK